MYRRCLLIPLIAIGCKNHASDEGSPPPTAPAKTASACAKATAEGPLAWIEDDYPAALACAKEKNVPLVLDLWAPWCHTCLSMKTTVFTDGSFKADAAKFVFASLDTDREGNAAVVAKFPLSAWPTFYVVGTDESVLARFVGSSSVAQFHAFLDAGLAARAGAAGADKHLLAAERALAAKDFATADTELTAAIAEAPPTWVRRPDALVSLISTKQKRGDNAGCAALGLASMRETGNSASAGDFAAIALGCATDLAKAKDPNVALVRAAGIARLRELTDDANAQLSIDDRSDIMLTLRETYNDLGQTDQAKQLAEKQRALLDDAAAKASTPMAAMTYNWQLAEVYVFLGRPLEAVPALEKSAVALPKEYDPRARLGWVYWKAGKLPEAAKWTDESLTMVYGPRKGRVLTQRAEIAAAAGDKDAEKRFRTEAVKLWESLPPGQASPESLAKAKDALAKLDTPAPAPATN